MLLKTIFTSLMLVFFTTTSIPVQAFGRKYSEMQLSSDIFIVSIKATETTTQNKAISGLLTRAAEITIRNGCHYFIVIDSQDQSDFKDSLIASNYTAVLKSSKIPHRQITIKCFKSQPTGDNAIDAKIFLDNKKKVCK